MRSEEKQRRATIAAAARLVLDDARQALQDAEEALPTIDPAFQAPLLDHGLRPAQQLAAELDARSLGTDAEGRTCQLLHQCAKRMIPVALLSAQMRDLQFVALICLLGEVRGRLDVIAERGAKAARAASAQRPNTAAAAIRAMAAAGASPAVIAQRLDEVDKHVDARHVRRVRSKIVG